jgi:hypothetical protein
MPLGLTMNPDPCSYFNQKPERAFDGFYERTSKKLVVI